MTNSFNGKLLKPAECSLGHKRYVAFRVNYRAIHMHTHTHSYFCALLSRMNTLGALSELLTRDELLNTKSLSFEKNERNCLNCSFVQLYLLADDWNSFALHWAQTVSNLRKNFRCEQEICLFVGSLKNKE